MYWGEAGWVRLGWEGWSLRRSSIENERAIARPPDERSHLSEPTRLHWRSSGLHCLNREVNEE